MNCDRGGRSGSSFSSTGKARGGQFTGDTHLSPLSTKNAGQTGLNRITHAVSSTSTRYAFAGQVIRRRTLPHFGGVFGVQGSTLTATVDGVAIVEVGRIAKGESPIFAAADEGSRQEGRSESGPSTLPIHLVEKAARRSGDDSRGDHFQ